MMAVIDKYAQQNGFAIVLDVSNQNTPVLYASNTVDITKEVIDLYDKTVFTATPAPRSPSGSAARGSSGGSLRLRQLRPNPRRLPLRRPPRSNNARTNDSRSSARLAKAEVDLNGRRRSHGFAVFDARCEMPFLDSGDGLLVHSLV